MDQLLANLPLLLLVSSRVAGVTAVSPVFSNRFLATQVRVVLTILLALLILPTVEAAPGTTEGPAFLLACLLELVVGLVIGFLSLLVFSVVQMAGAMLDMDMGLAMAQIMDPVSSHSEPLLGSFFQTLALMLYFALNAHHWLLRALAQSYSLIPPAGLAPSAPSLLGVANLLGGMLGTAVEMVLPFIGTMLIATAVMAALNRAVQQIQIFQVAIGVKAVAGLAMLALILPFFLGFIEPLFSNGHQLILRTLDVMR